MPNREKKNLNIKELEANASKRIDLDALPQELEAIPTEQKVEKDKNKQDCLYVEFAYGDSSFTQKYSPYHFNALVDAFKAIKVDGFDQAIKEGLKLKMRKKSFAMGFARFLPIEVMK
jgi:hypothetical protein